MNGKDADFLKKLLATFKVEAAEHIAALSSGLIELENTPDAEKRAKVVERLFREVHSMKGAARSVNLSAMETVCQALESVFASLKRGEVSADRDIFDLLHRSVNRLGGLLSYAGEAGAPSEKTEVKDIVRELGRVISAGALTEERICPPAVEAPPPDGFPAVAETVRISKQRLDSILIQAEEFLAAKQLVGRLSADLRKIAAMSAALRKEGPGGPEGERISRLHEAIAGLSKTADSDHRTLALMVDGLLEDVKSVSMLPFSSLLEILPKVVRDLAYDRGKEAVATVRGGEIEIDRRILDEMREPLIHLVRNCIDHGIEKTEERAAGGKPRAGAVMIDVSHGEGKSVEVVVSDDGAGIDTAKVMSSALKLGILSKEDAKGIDEGKLLSLIFRSGVTTSPIITDISGRGLGLAIVQEKAEKLGGSLSCETAAGKGTAFRIRLPLTLATFRGVLVRIDDRHFIIPIQGLDCTARTSWDDIKTVENRETIRVEGRTVPFVPLRAVLELPVKEKAGGKTGTVQSVVLGGADKRIAFRVDEVLHEQEVLVKDLGRQLKRVRNISGATVLGTGKVVPVLNAADLLKSASRVSPVTEAPVAAGETSGPGKAVLVVEDSITARTLLKNILDAAGYNVQTAVDGVDAFSTLKTGGFDLVVSDIDMPRMNGLELTAKIRSDRQLGGLPVILVTALESREDRERGIDVGANAYIVKSSFDQSNLLEVIKRLI